MTDGVQSLVAGAVVGISVTVPLLVMSKLYRQPSPVYQGPWRGTLALISLAIASPLAGYYLAGALSVALESAGWRLAHADPGFPVTVFLLVAAAFLFGAHLAIVLTLVMRRASAGGKMASD
jgi:hypothetical protein